MQVEQERWQGLHFISSRLKKVPLVHSGTQVIPAKLQEKRRKNKNNKSFHNICTGNREMMMEDGFHMGCHSLGQLKCTLPAALWVVYTLTQSQQHFDGEPRLWGYVAENEKVNTLSWTSYTLQLSMTCLGSNVQRVPKASTQWCRLELLNEA